MHRLRSASVLALLWLAALAGSSDPDGFRAPGGLLEPAVAVSADGGGDARAHAVAERDGRGKRWSLTVDPSGKRWC